VLLAAAFEGGVGELLEQDVRLSPPSRQKEMAPGDGQFTNRSPSS
jgi:hypothetical protein